MKKTSLFTRAALLLTLWLQSMIFYASGVEFSAAGFFPLEGTGRQAYSLNPAWRFYKGIPEGHPYDSGYDDSRWEAVSLPHGLEYLPVFH